jgi:hypothetical protein
MKTLTKYVIATSVGSLLAAGAHAFNVTATVANTITLTETTPFTLGNVFVRLHVDTDTDSVPAYLTINPTTGAATTTAGTEADASPQQNSKLVSLGGVTVGVLSVSGAQPFGTLTVTHGTKTDLVHSSGNPALPTIKFTTLTTSPADAATLTLDGTGAGQIKVGGVFTAQEDTATGGNAYQDGTYTGTYAVTVSY